MRAWRVVVAIPMGFLAATVLGNIVLVFFGVYKIDVSQLSGQVSVGVILAGSIILPVLLVRGAPSVRETFRRSLPLVGFSSLCLDLIAVVLLAEGVSAVPETNGPLVDALGSFFADLILLAPVLCPVLYYWVVPSESQLLRGRAIRYRSNSDSRKWVLTALVVAGAVAAMGIAAGNPGLALLGIIGVVGFAVVLIWAD
jgi:hypothetical protein